MMEEIDYEDIGDAWLEIEPNFGDFKELGIRFASAVYIAMCECENKIFTQKEFNSLLEDYFDYSNIYDSAAQVIAWRVRDAHRYLENPVPSCTCEYCGQRVSSSAASSSPSVARM